MARERSLAVAIVMWLAGSAVIACAAPGRLALSTSRSGPRSPGIEPSDTTAPGAPSVGGASPAASSRLVQPFCNVLPCRQQLVERRILEREQRIGPVVCRGNFEAGFAPAGHLVYCNVAHETTLDGFSIQADGYTRFGPDGHVEETTMAAWRSFALADGSTVVCAAGDVGLDEERRLHFCVLGAPLTKRVRCRVGKGISFYSDASLGGATLDEPLRVGPLTLPSGTWVGWSEQGVVTSATFEGDVRAVVGGIAVRGDISFYPSGAPREVTLVDGASVQGHRLPRSATVVLREDGTLEAATYSEHTGTMPHGELTEDVRTLSFDRGGAVDSSSVRHDSSEIPFPRR